MTQYIFETLEELHNLIIEHIKPTDNEHLTTELVKGDVDEDAIKLTYYHDDEEPVVNVYNDLTVTNLSPLKFIESLPHVERLNYNGILKKLYSFTKKDKFLKPELGQPIELSKKVMVSDPSYKLNTWCQGTVNVTPGTYIPQIVKVIDGSGWGTRVAKLECWLEGYEPNYNNLTNQHIVVGVDSGTAGIYDYDYYVKHHSEEESLDENWYGRLTPWVNKKVPLHPVEQKAVDKLVYLSQLRKQFATLGDHTILDKINRDIYKIRQDYYLWGSLEELKTGFKVNEENIVKTSDKKGATSSTGLGDGSYKCYLAYTKDKSKVIGIILDYWGIHKNKDDDTDD